MARIDVSGIEIEYELLGDAGAPAIAITPGGRFRMDAPGVTELGQELAKGGKRVLLWNRPNCGGSDISFNGPSESELSASTLIELIGKLKLGKTALAAGSAGSRVSLIAASRAPDAVSHLAVWWISGGALGLIALANYYCCNSATEASRRGMEGVAALPEWQDQIKRNPRNRDILLSQDPKAFIKKMEQWALFYLPNPETPVPGVSKDDWKRITMPVMIVPNSKTDLAHTFETSEWVTKLIPHAKILAAPWTDNEWNTQSDYAAKHGSGHFVNWPLLAPALLDFTAK